MLQSYTYNLALAGPMILALGGLSGEPGTSEVRWTNSHPLIRCAPHFRTATRLLSSWHGYRSLDERRRRRRKREERTRRRNSSFRRLFSRSSPLLFSSVLAPSFSTLHQKYPKLDAPGTERRAVGRVFAPNESK